jgi:hypothetical protein
MITNNYLFSSQFLDFLKSQKIKEKDLFEGFVASLKTYIEKLKKEKDISYIEGIVAQLQFASEQPIRMNNSSNYFCYLYEGFPLNKKVSCLYYVSPDIELDATKKGNYPAFELINLLKREQLEWGILTNGAIWRLYSTLTSLPYENYLEIDFNIDDDLNYKVFWQLFSLALFLPDENEVTPLEKYIDESKKETKLIEDHIHNKIDEIFENICFGFLTY